MANKREKETGGSTEISLGVMCVVRHLCSCCGALKNKAGVSSSEVVWYGTILAQSIRHAGAAVLPYRYPTHHSPARGRE